MTEQPFLRIGSALVNINAVASVRTNDRGELKIRFLVRSQNGPYTLTVKPESAAAVSRALESLVNKNLSVQDAVLED